MVKTESVAVSVSHIHRHQTCSLETGSDRRLFAKTLPAPAQNLGQGGVLELRRLPAKFIQIETVYGHIARISTKLVD